MSDASPPTEPAATKPAATKPAATKPAATKPAASEPGAPSAAPAESLLEAALRCRPVPRTPVWFMRQAGRALPEYRALREGVAMLDACTRPDLVVEITLQPVRRYRVDAAILFSDIVLPLRAAGTDLDIRPGVGPVIASPVRDAAGVAAVGPLDPGSVAFVAESVRALVAELGDTPLIGFAGAPFTLASYLIEGGPSRHHDLTRSFMRSEPALWHDLLGRLAAVSATFLEVQVQAGARVVQLFDSWVGALSAADYRQFVMPHTRAVFERLAPYGIPRIHFGVGTGELLHDLRRAGADAVGVDWRVPLDVAARRVGPGVALQGNLDPAALLAPWPVVEREARRILAEAEDLPGHVFNLGHGVLPSVDPDVLTRLVALVQEESGRA